MKILNGCSVGLVCWETMFLMIHLLVVGETFGEVVLFFYHRHKIEAFHEAFINKVDASLNAQVLEMGRSS